MGPEPAVRLVRDILVAAVSAGVPGQLASLAVAIYATRSPIQPRTLPS
jgi:hypothetical protein